MARKKVSAKKTSRRSVVGRKKPVVAKKQKVSTEKPSSDSLKDPWSLVRRNHDRFVRLGSFGDIAQAPSISDVEIVVCFVDVRGFTKYCNELQKVSLDARIQNFLRNYFGIFSPAVMEEMWRLEPDDQSDSLSHVSAELRKILPPASYKNLGDGMMLVWEIPQDATEVIQGKATHKILSIAISIFKSFNRLFRDPGVVGMDAYSELVKDLRLGIGLSRGHAWKLDFGKHLKYDYSGSVVNLAARLQDLARPEGVVCQIDFSRSLLEALASSKIGVKSTVKGVKGLGDQYILKLSESDCEKIYKNVQL